MTTSSTAEFLSNLRKLNVAVSVHNGSLRCNAPARVMTAELRAELAERTPEIQRILQNGPNGPNGPNGSNGSGGSERPSEGIQRVARDGKLPLSFAQQRLWFLAQLDGASQAYHVPLILHMRGALDHAVLRRALDRILARHEALRTTFSARGAEPRQLIKAKDESRFLLVEEDLRQNASARGDLDQLIELEASAPFDLEAGPLIRGRLFQVADDEHVLAIIVHHIASDGWSVPLLIKELRILYTAFVEGRDDPQPELAVQYADFAVWQRKWMEGDSQRQQADYWKKALAGAPTILEVPADHPRPERQSYAGAFENLVLDESLTASLKELSRRHQVTLFMTLMAAWAALVARLSGQQDVLIGTPTANRTRNETRDLIGFFVNTLVVRLDLSGSPRVTDLLQQTRERSVAAMQNQDFPFDRVVELVNPARNGSHSPLVQVMFAWQNNVQESPHLPGIEVRSLPLASKTAKFDLVLDLHQAGNTICGGIEYATSLFEPSTIKRYLEYFRALLAAMVVDESQIVDRLPILSQAERDRLLFDWNDTAADFPAAACVHQLFEEQARKTPHATAVVSQDRTLTYGQLNRHASQLAETLRKISIGAGDTVALALERSVDLIAAEIAILKCGARYMPLDPSYPAERKAFLIADSGAKAVLCLSETKLPRELTAVRVDLDRVKLDAGATRDLDAAIDGDAPACIMYTSGSTGQPKGAIIPHRAITRLAINNRYAKFGPESRVAFASNPAFDASTLEVWAPLLNGGRIVVIAPDVLLDPARLGKAITQHAIDTLWITVGLFNRYWDALSAEFSSLRYLMTGGDALDPGVMAEFLRRGSPQHLLNCYGPTETTTFATTYEIRRVAGGAHSIPIGRPIGNTRAYILDAHREPVPIGVAGELYIGGAGVAHGYLNRAELTAERFLPDPFTSSGALMYKTGDLCRWLLDGNIDFLGRNDFQVKIRGFRIEPGEIETRLKEHAAVREALVLAREDSPGDKRLVAYYTSAAGPDGAGAEQLRAHLSATLPEYMVPANYVCVEQMPLNSNGKVNRKALPAPEAGALTLEGYEPPQGELETRLAGIWADVLKVDRIGRHDNFFDLGGHSLLALQFVLRLKKEIEGASVPMAAFLEAPTVARLAARLEYHLVNRPQILVQMRKGDPAVLPLFFISAPDSTALRLRALAKCLDSEVPIYCLQNKGLDGSIPFASIEEAARTYLEEIRSVQPHGPYRFAGYCFGGVVAFEMARMIEQAGERVASLLLIDSFNPAYLRFNPTGEMLRRLLDFYSRRIRMHARRMISLSGKTWPRYAAGRTKAIFVHFSRFVKRTGKLNDTLAAEAKALDSDQASQFEIEKILHRLRRAGTELLRRYDPEPYHGDVVVIRVSERNDDPFEDLFLGWKPLVNGQMESFEISSTHEAILREPAVEQLAEVIDAQLGGGPIAVEDFIEPAKAGSMELVV